jgi:hypothetical protein
MRVLDLSAANDGRAEDEVEVVHGLTPHGLVACRGIHVVRAVRLQLGYVVRALTGDAELDGEAITCPDCRAVLGLSGQGAA